LTPCDIATRATEAPGTAHSARICAFNSALCRLRRGRLSLAIVST